ICNSKFPGRAMNDGTIDLDTRRGGRPGPFRIRDLSELEGREVPHRDWLIPSVLIRRSITLFAGDGGGGKSLMCQQLQVAAALGVDWLGLPVKEPITSFGYYCEDDEEEVHRRFFDICRHYGCSCREPGNKVTFACRVGEKENKLVHFRGKGDFAKPERPPVYAQVAEIVKEYGIQMTILDTISDIFAGNENIRYQVKSFVTLIRGLALINNGGVILTSHPSKSAMIDGSGFSGSTAWNGAVRNRLYLTAPQKKEDEGDVKRTDERTLRIMKSNYGPFGEKIRCKWDNGCFSLSGSTTGSIIDRLHAKDKILEAARYLVDQGTFCIAGDNTRSSLTALASRLPSCREFSFGILRAAQDAL